MVTEADEASMRNQQEHQEAVDGGEKVKQTPEEMSCGASATADDPDVWLEEEQEREGDVAMTEEQDRSITTTTVVGVEDASDEDTADGNAGEASSALNDGADLDESSTVPESVSDLFGGCTTLKVQAQIPKPRDCEQGDGHEALSDQVEESSPCDESQDQHQMADPTTTEQSVSLEQGGSRVDPKDPAKQQTTERLDDLVSPSANDESLQTPDALVEDEAAPVSDPAANANDALSTLEAQNDTQTAAACYTLGVKRVAPSPTSALPAFSWNDILCVQNLIERCLQQYLTKREILEALQAQASIDPAFADVVWQKLEEQNPSFFRAYHIQLRLKEQIIAFNYLVAQQKEMSAKRIKRRHVRTSNAVPTSSRRRGSTSGGIFSPTATFSAADSLFAGVGDGSEPGRGGGMSASTANSLIAQLPPPSPLPLPSPIKTELDTHAFFT